MPMLVSSTQLDHGDLTGPPPHSFHFFLYAVDTVLPSGACSLVASLSHPHESSSLLPAAPISTHLIRPVFKYRFFPQVALVVK